jgi:hypothetical protein
MKICDQVLVMRTNKFYYFRKIEISINDDTNITIFNII